MLEKFYEQSGVVGVLDARAYYIPFRAGEDAFAPRGKSGRFISLNGKWKIDAYESMLDVKDDFFLSRSFVGNRRAVVRTALRLRSPAIYQRKLSFSV